MPDPTATPAPETPPAPVASSQSPAPEVQLSDEAKAAGFTADDFKHPEYGFKAKNLYQGFQKVGEARSKAEKETNEIKAFIQSNPKVLKAVREQWRELQGLPPEETAPGDPNDETPPADDPKLNEARLALSELYSHLGSGDPYKGQTAYEKEWAPEVNAILVTLNPNLPPRDRLRLALEHVRLQRSQKPSATPPPPPPGTSAASESDRGAAGSPPPKSPKDMTDDEIIQRALKAGNYPDLPSFLMSQTLTGKARLSGNMR